MAALQIHDHRGADAVDLRRYALHLWPGLDRRKLSRTRGEPGRIAKLVARRTALSEECITGILRRRAD